MPNIELRCVDCDSVFYFSERDQAFYQEKGYEQPKRCYKCRQAKKAQRQNNPYKPYK